MVGVWLLFVVMGLPSLASAAWKTDTALQAAREALRLGQMKGWKQALLKGEKAFASERSKMPLETRTNASLWLKLMWAKYYQYSGTLPAVREVKSFENRAALQSAIRDFRKALALLKRSLSYYEQYNGLYTQTMDRSRLQSQIYLQASLGLARDLRDRLRTGKIYVAFLQYAFDNWNNKSRIKANTSNNRKQQAALQKLQAMQASMALSQSAMKKQQRTLAASLQRSQALYQTLASQTSSKRVIGAMLMTTGILAIAAGGVLGALGGIQFKDFLDKESAGNCVKPGCAELDPYRNESIVLMASGGGGVVLGTVLLIVGVSLLPSPQAETKNVVKAQNAHLRSENASKPRAQ
jgi:hypothetical protein